MGHSNIKPDLHRKQMTNPKELNHEVFNSDTIERCGQGQISQQRMLMYLGQTGKPDVM